ncbi:uncharacterized protein LOC126696013 [Quercus robur]|uniref:uncharacterized protein LOC126696013 n=1 Tax=Quercus robur TaxID=38942 RepID=UPI0021633C02|nr:uncharacterized protein LOC126696013 [Quercus robur]
MGMDSSIPRDTSFTNLLEDSYDEYMSGSSHISGEDSIPQTLAFSQMSLPQVESAAKKLQRGSNFSIQEDVLLVSAFLNVNQDVVQSTNQKRTTYWSRIWEYYHQWKTFTSERMVGSLTNRWSTIQLCTNKFCGCLAQIESKNENGKTDEDKVSIVNLERPPGVKTEKERLKKQKCKEGMTLHIEDILNVTMEERRKTNEMKMTCIKKGCLAEQEHEIARIQLKDKKLEIVRMKMELDMKRSKEEYEMEKLRMEKLKEDNEMEKLRMEKLKEDNEMEKLKMNQMKEEKELMMMDVSMLSSVQQEYIHQCQMEILEKRRSRS